MAASDYAPIFFKNRLHLVGERNVLHYRRRRETGDQRHMTAKRKPKKAALVLTDDDRAVLKGPQGPRSALRMRAKRREPLIL
jgi:hypothetical protein